MTGLQAFRERGFAGPGPDNGPVDVVVGPDAKMWTLDQDGSLSRLDHGVLRRVTRDIGTVSRQITVDGLGRIAQLTFGRKGGIVLRRTWPDGRHDDVPAPGHDDPAPDGDLVTDPNGTVWFGRLNTGPGAAFTGVTVDGHVKNLKIPPTYQGTAGDTLTIGPDGNIWFDSGLGVGRFTPDGHFLPWTEILPTDSVDTITRVARGSQDNIWAGVVGRGALLRIDPKTHVDTRYGLFVDPDLVDHSFLFWTMAPGPGADIWPLAGFFFDDYIDQIIGDFVSPLGSNGLLNADDSYFLPSLKTEPHNSPEHYGLTAGLDGRMWFTERLFGRLEAWRSPFWRPSPRGHTRVIGTKRIGTWLRVDLGCTGTTGGYCTGTLQLKANGHKTGHRLPYAIAAGPKTVNSHIARWLPIPRTGRTRTTKLTVARKPLR